MDNSRLYAALSGEMSDFSARLARLQDVTLISGEPLAGPALMDAMVAVQDLDRLVQDAAALSGFLGDVADTGDDTGSVQDALGAMSLRSLAERLATRMA